MTYIRFFSTSFLLLLSGFFVKAQVVTTTPVLPDPNDTVTIIFDATKGDGGLAGFTGAVYAHAGVITTKSFFSSDWKYVQGVWGQPTAKTLMTPLGNDKYQLKYHVRNFYGVPLNEIMVKLAFVFRNADGTLTGKDVGGADIFIDLAPPSSPVAALPSGLQDGINILNDSTVTLVLFAPNKDYSLLIGSFDDWEASENNLMNLTPDRSRYWKTLTGLTPGKEYIYQYLVDGYLRIADYYAHKVLDPWSDPQIPAVNYPNLIPYPTGKTDRIASVFQTAPPQYNWQVNNFQPPKKEDMVVYELHVRDFSDEDNYQFIFSKLDYLQDLGINAIEFMPVNEFENNDSWGYNPSFHLALDKYYGTEMKFKELIDSCHARGMAVILDVVLNHAFGQSPMAELYWDAANNRPSLSSPWFNPIPKHDFNVGNDFNHESQATKQYVYRTVKYWIEEYHIDGYRFDLSKGFTQKNTLGNIGAWGQYDADRVAILKAIADTIWATDQDAYVILEHFADNNEETELANYGMMFWGNSNYNYNQATMGYGDSNFDWVSYQRRGWNDPNVLGFMESHDEERLMFKNLEYGNSSGSYNIKDLGTALKRVELGATFFLPIPGPKMIWQFGELGYDVNIDFNGRTGRKPVRWEYYTDSRRRHLYQVFASLAKLKQEEPAFETANFTLNLASDVSKTIHLNHPSMNVAILGNFNVVSGNINPNFQAPGTWYEFFSGDSLVVTNTTQQLNLAPGEYRLYSTKKLDRTVITTDLESLVPGENAYVSVFPNPAQSDVNISFQLSAPTRVTVDVLDLSGRHVARVFEGQRNAGLQQLGWNVREAGLTPGLYLVRIQANGREAVSKLVVR